MSAPLSLRPSKLRGSLPLWHKQLLDILLENLPQPIPEYRFHPQRRWRFDYAWPEKRVALELEGGQWIRGRAVHRESDCLKYSYSQVMGWKVLRFTWTMLQENYEECRALVEDALK